MRVLAAFVALLVALPAFAAPVITSGNDQNPQLAKRVLTPPEVMTWLTEIRNALKGVAPGELENLLKLEGSSSKLGNTMVETASLAKTPQINKQDVDAMLKIALSQTNVLPKLSKATKFALIAGGSLGTAALATAAVVGATTGSGLPQAQNDEILAKIGTVTDPDGLQKYIQSIVAMKPPPTEEQMTAYYNAANQKALAQVEAKMN
ncbi:hypothetical protein FRB99_006432 [Tulasnella sp. 403]|nr:hypothetical protein FRB99_006432 [Tulasnella sp. 403]